MVSVVPPLAESEAAHCPRCHHVLYSRKHCPAQHALAVAMATLIALLMALPFPFIAFEARGVTRSIDLFDAMTILTSQHYATLALLLWLVLLVLPLLFLLGVILIHAALLSGRRLPAPGLMDAQSAPYPSLDDGRCFSAGRAGQHGQDPLPGRNSFRNLFLVLLCLCGTDDRDRTTYRHGLAVGTHGRAGTPTAG
ncbi:hypothetical protein BH688_12945 [Kushneria phosphatilytica]|nr:hypothetical protein BH688_12945 [Kushneria phosphatilytica]